MKFQNSQGKVYYGMHFYPGVCQYDEADKQMRVYWNEDTIRKIGPSFRGRPVFVEHVDEVEENLDELRKEVDGWVVRSFFNQADGKHWCEFIVCSDRAERAIANGYGVSNCFIAEKYGKGGYCNSVPYDAEIQDAYFEHLAIVKNPRYEQSIILTPEEFQKYNEDKLSSLAKFSNSKKKKGAIMGLKLFKKEKMKNSAELEEMSVILPKSGKEMTVVGLVNAMDEIEEKKKGKQYANSLDLVKVEDEEISVEALLERVKALEALVAELQAGETDENEFENEDDDSKEESDDDSFDNEDDEEDAAEKKLEEAKKKDKKKNSAPEKKLTPKEEAAKRREENRKKNSSDDDAKKKAKEKADKLRMANSRAMDDDDEDTVEFMSGVERGKSRYGSGS